MTGYLDHAATSPMSEAVRQVYLDALAVVGNPSSIHQSGQRARDMVERARADIALLLGVDPIEVIFTSGGTESINTWIKGRVLAARAKGTDLARPAIVLTRAEHHATLDAVEWLVKMGFARVAWVEVDDEGRMDIPSLKAVLSSLDPAEIAGLTSLVANNEVGSIQPVGEIVATAQEYGAIPVHLDAIQAFGQIPIDWNEWPVDAMSITAHKVGGPVGVGALVLRRGAAGIEPLLHGGGQQTFRSGTLDAAGAAAFAFAAQESYASMAARTAHAEGLRNRLMAGLTAAAPGVRVRGNAENRLPHNVHVTVEGADGEVMLYLLDQHSISVSTGSACQSGVAEPSHVLLAMGLPPELAKGALRFSLGPDTTSEEVERAIGVFGHVVEQARQAS